MAKSMARIDENNIVINIEWRSDNTIETDTLKDYDDLLLEIGDTYADGKFYRDGVRLLTPIEAAYETNAELTTALQTLGVKV